MPLLRGAQVKIVLAYMDRCRLRRVFERSLADPLLAPDVRRIGKDWTTFSVASKEIRQRGHDLARGELDRGVVGIAAPVLDADGEIVESRS